MTLDAIISHYKAGTLANEPDLVLHDAQVKIGIWRNWRYENPTAKPEGVPQADLLQTVYDFIEKTASRRYGCND